MTAADPVPAREVGDRPLAIPGERHRRRPADLLKSWDWPVIAACLPALLIPLYVLAFVLTGSRMQGLDYFMMLDQIVDPAGNLEPGGLLTHQSEHLVLIPKLVYLANGALTGGSNIALGLFAWAGSCATLLLLLVAVLPSLAGRRWLTVLVVWLLVVYLFPLQAIHHYAVGMSGTAWITANLFVVGAIVALTRDRAILAGVLGVAATLTYGTGLALWPALAMVLVLRRRVTWRDIVMFAMGAAAVAFALRTATITDDYRPDYNPLNSVQPAAITVGSLFTDALVPATVLGLLFMALFALLAVIAFRRRSTDMVVAWVAIGAFTVGTFVMFGMSRAQLMLPEVFTASRYMGLSALFALATSMLLLSLYPTALVARVGVVVAAAASLVTAPGIVGQYAERHRPVADTSAIAAALGVGDGVVPGFSADTEGALRARQHYPFTAAFTDGCGLLLKPLPSAPVSDPDRASGEITRFVPTQRAPLVFTRGNADASWVDGTVRSTAPVECVLITDSRGVVVGAATPTRQRPFDFAPPQQPRPWTGVARTPADGGIRVVVTLAGEPGFFAIQAARAPIS